MSTEQVKRCCEIAGCVLVFWPRDSQSSIARPPCRHGNNRSALRFDWNNLPIPRPRFVCRGSRGRQGSNVGPTPSHRHRRRRHVMLWSQGRELHCFFLHHQAIDVPPPRSPRRCLWANTQSCINNPPRYIGTLCPRGDQRAGEKAQMHLSKMGG